MTLQLSKTAEYIRALPVEDCHDDFIVKIANARDLIANLPSPNNLNRDLSRIPPVNIAFTLSTSSKLPDYVASKIVDPDDQKIFSDEGLLGLCMSGRGMPVEIFLHEHFLIATDPSGEMLEEVAFHEVMHGIEGIEQDQRGRLHRYSPWSYELQQRMLEMDRESGHKPSFHENPVLKVYEEYLRSGTGLQQNVSEIFARVAVANMYEIKETGQAFTSFSQFLKRALKKVEADKLSRKEWNMLDFITGFNTYSADAQNHLIMEGDNMIGRVAELYGYESP